METNMCSSTTSRNAWRTCIGLASLLAFGTIAWQHLVHAWTTGANVPLAGHLSHALRDGALAWPLAILAVVAGLRLFRRLNLGELGTVGLVARTALITVGFAALMVPAVVGHALIDAGLREGSAAALAMAASISANLGRFLDYSVREALTSLVAAMPLTLMGLVVSDASPSSPRHRRWSRRLAPAAAVVVLLVGGGIGRAKSDVVEFEATDDPGSWFKCVGVVGCVAAGTQSLAVAKSGDTVC